FLGDGGPATSARLQNPAAIAVDGPGNLYISDRSNHRVRRVDSGTGTITTVAGNGTASSTGDGGAATAASINFPGAMAIDSAGDVYVADEGGDRIRKVDTGTGVITTF